MIAPPCAEICRLLEPSSALTNGRTPNFFKTSVVVKIITTFEQLYLGSIISLIRGLSAEGLSSGKVRSRMKTLKTSFRCDARFGLINS